MRVDPYQRTSAPRVFCAGEATGVAGVDSRWCKDRSPDSRRPATSRRPNDSSASVRSISGSPARSQDAFQLRPSCVRWPRTRQ